MNSNEFVKRINLEAFRLAKQLETSHGAIIVANEKGFSHVPLTDYAGLKQIVEEGDKRMSIKVTNQHGNEQWMPFHQYLLAEYEVK